MANRFTDTTKWDDDWYLSLPPKMKCAWQYICDNCGSIGDLKISFSLISFRIGEKVTKEDFETHFGDRLVWVSDDKIWIVSYIEFQYKTLSTKNIAHRGIIKKILDLVDGRPLTDPQLTLISGWRDTLQCVKEEDKEKEEDKNLKKEEDAFAAKDLLDLWEKNCGDLPKVREFTDERKKKALSQVKKHPDSAYWLEVIERWKLSEFCLNEWKPSFDELLSAKLRTRTLEGKYDNRADKAPSQGTQSNRTRKLLDGIKKFNSYEGDELKEFLGEDLFRLACRVGISRIRGMPADTFLERNVEGLLKEADAKAAS